MPLQETSRYAIPALMDGLRVTSLQTEAERRSYLQGLSPEQFLGDIATVSSIARNLIPEQNILAPTDRIVVFKNDNCIEKTAGIRYIAPRRALGEQALATSLEIAKKLPHVNTAGALMRLMIPLAHIQVDGNGAAARFYQKLMIDGYDGTFSTDKEYEALLASQGRPEQEYQEGKWHNAFAQYHTDQVSKRHNLPFTPAGYMEINWQGEQLSKLPFLQCGQGLYMVEDNFATAFDIDFMAKTGRDVRDYTVEQRQRIRKKRYIDTSRLLLDAQIEESALAQDIGDTHKSDYLMAVNDYFATGSHPAFPQ